MTLRRRLTLALVATAVAAAACFSLMGIVFVYTVEDDFFDRMLEQEAPGVVRYASVDALPLDLRPQVDPGARRGEYFGSEGRHYHLLKSGDGYLVAEVSKQLAVRPRLPTIVGVLAVMAMVLALLVGGIGYLFARRATAPLERLARLLESSEPGQLPRGLGQNMRDDEIGVLARALDAAMLRVADFIERELHFTRDASHELRTPLAVMAGAAALIESESLSQAGCAQLHRIRDACALMQRTTDTLLMLSREDSTQATDPERLLPLIEDAIVRHAAALDGRQLEVTVDIPTEASLVMTKGVLEILLANILGNTIAHASPGPVRIAFADDILSITNCGQIPAGLEGSLFAEGVKGPSSQGLGLGLSIAQRLATRAGFDLSISSNDGLVVTNLKIKDERSVGGGGTGLRLRRGRGRPRSG